jgi:hypothetical protein
MIITSTLGGGRLEDEFGRILVRQRRGLGAR